MHACIYCGHKNIVSAFEKGKRLSLILINSLKDTFSSKYKTISYVVNFLALILFILGLYTDPCFELLQWFNN